jgi:hypothetical protein
LLERFSDHERGVPSDLLPAVPTEVKFLLFSSFLLSSLVDFDSHFKYTRFALVCLQTSSIIPLILLREFLPAKMQLFMSAAVLLICGISLVSSDPFSPVTVRAISPDNTCGKNGTGGGADGYTCSSTLPCCSVNGFCGSTSEYCLTTAGCQAAFGNCTAPSAGTISPDETCGIIGAGTAGYTCDAASPCCSGK